MKKIEKSKYVQQLILMNVHFFMDASLLKEYNLFSQNTESFLEQ